MKNESLTILTALLHCLQAGQPAWLLTVVRTFGASPRPVGSMLLVDGAGHCTGSVSGGCVEEDLVGRLLSGDLAPEEPDIIEYGLNAEDNERLGLPCGGRLHLLLEPVSPERISTVELTSLLEDVGRGRSWRRETNLGSGHWQLAPTERCTTLQLDDARLMQSFGPRRLLLLIGANALGVSLAEIAVALDYRVVVCDPRAEFRRDWPLSDVELTDLMPDDAVREYACHRETAVVTLTHDPRIDDMALMEALTGPAFYVGALGSERTSQARRERLAQLDLSQPQIARLRAPVGLAIGSKTPAEIAVAIAAELTAITRSASD